MKVKELIELLKQLDQEYYIEFTTPTPVGNMTSDLDEESFLQESVRKNEQLKTYEVIV